MLVPLNDTAREHRSLQAELEDAVLGVLRRGRYVLGAEHDAFETELAEFLGVGRVLGVGNGTDALEIALRAVGAGPGRQVVTAGNAGGYGAVAARLLGADVVVADVDPGTLLLDPVSAAAACTPQTAAVVVTHLYGRAADVPALRAVLPPGVAVVEDCAQAAGARVGDLRCGSLGDIAAFSFYPTKNLGAAGDGGAVATADPALAEQVARLRQYGWTERFRVGLPGGRNSRLDELQAAVLRVKLRHLDGWNGRRRAVAEQYAAAAARTRLAFAAPGPGDVAHLAVGTHPDRDGLAARLLAAGITTAVHYPVPDHHQSGLAAVPGPTGTAGVEQACREVLSLPCSPLLSDAEVDQVAAAVAELA